VSTLTGQIEAFLAGLGDEELFPYIYNRTGKAFQVDKDWVYYSGPPWDEREVVAAIETLLAGRWLPSGPKVAQFETQFSRKFNFNASLMVNSGSSANLVMIAALKKHCGWSNGDEVIVSAVGFPTTTAPIVQNNLRPRFVDITMDDLNFDLLKVEAAMNSKTRAVLLSPVLGNPPNMDQLTEMCRANGVQLVLDGCDSLGTRWRGRHLSEYAAATSCSFYPAHHISTGEGGMVSSDDEELVKLARSIAWWGRDCYCVGPANLLKNGSCKKRFSKWCEDLGVIDHKYFFTNMGYNLKPLDLQGAIGSEQLKKFDDLHSGRRRAKRRIHELFEMHTSSVRVIDEPQHSETGWFGVPLVCENARVKAELVQHLEGNRIQTRNYFAGNILQHPGYRDLDDSRLYPLANRVLDEVLFVGCHPSYGEDVFEYIEGVVKRFNAPRSKVVLPLWDATIEPGSAMQQKLEVEQI